MIIFLIKIYWAGSIPVYCGNFDEIDELIFNKNRIIFYNPFDDNSLKQTFTFINKLMNNQEEFNNFYKQSVFCSTASSTIINMRSNILELINKLLK